MANINVSGNFSTSSDLVAVNYLTDVENITKVELTKDNTNFITANSFTNSKAIFNVSTWDYGTYSCKLRMTHAQNPLTLIQYKEINNNGAVVDTTDGKWWSTVTSHSVSANTSYTLSLNHVSYVVICFYDTNGNYLDYVEANTSDWSIGQLTTAFTTVANTAKILISVTGDNTQSTASISPNDVLVTTSNNFNIIIITDPTTEPTEPTEPSEPTEPTEPSAPTTDPSTVIEITKAGVALTPVNTTPTTGQYKVTIENTTNCTAILESDNKTITVTGATSNDGQIDIRVNIENKRIYTKSIAVANMLKTSVVNSKMSEVKQTADKINLLVRGETSSELTMTDTFIRLISNNITLTADHINLNGYVSNDDANWSIDNEGNIHAGNLNVDDKLSVDTIVVNNIDSPKYPGVLTENIKLYIGTSGNDNSELESWATFQTFDGLLDRLPKNLNGHEVHIEMSTDITEDVEFKGFHGGRIKVLMKGHTLYGYVNSEMCSARIAFYSGYIGDNTNEDNGWGKIHPSKGYPVGNYTTTVSCVDSGSIALYNIDVYGADNYLTGSTSKVGMAAFMWASIYSNGTSCYGCDIMGRANVGGRIHDVASWNTAAKYGWYATSGGYITLASGSHTGGTTKDYHETHAGKVIVVDSTTFEGNTVQAPEAPAPTTSTTKTVTYKSNYGDTYRSTVYNSWKKDNTVRQGDYGYGNCSGLWFFGSQFSDLEGKTINKVTIKITRQSGGSYAAVGLAVRTHNYSARPSGAPTLSSSSYGTLSLATGATGTLTITDSAVLNGIKNGTIKGFGIRTTYDSTHYAVCSGSVTVKITYTE